MLFFKKVKKIIKHVTTVKKEKNSRKASNLLLTKIGLQAKYQINKHDFRLKPSYLTYSYKKLEQKDTYN